MAKKHIKVKKSSKGKQLRLPKQKTKLQYKFLKNLQKKVSNTIKKLTQTLQMRKGKTLKRK